ncbi:uncharacterized protein PAC_17234 [Phialocephala subalpina]|uniref:BZIP domain-containing protein n=1 Tax=Phialocephala subalpina TaxID=576137 RepID=A0A1L7XQQ1_9HELO|nr:uncharacterized protein PAC_17234 [Phialocephala subalpina]
MSENFPQNPAVLVARESKRKRSDDDLRRERKRKADRMAQKISREKRRLYTDQLERTINILCKEDGRAVTYGLMEEISLLRAENGRLRRIIDGVKSALSSETSTAPPDPVIDDNTLRSARAEGFLNGDVRGSVDNVQSASNATPEPNVWASNGLAQMETEVDREMREDYPDTTANVNFESPIEFTDSWMDNMIYGSRSSTSWPGLSRARPQPFPSPLSTMMPVASRPRGTAQCQIWQRSNTIYSQVSKVGPACSSAALKLSSTYYAASIFKAVIKGWTSLSIQERSNPILRILREIDQVFPQLDRTSRVAFMYKSHMVLKYLLNPEERNLEQMPQWQRPRHLQSTKQHPIAIDFFVWPALRDRLVETHHDYFTTSDFSIYFRNYYKFSWPFPFEDTYIYCKDTNTYQLSPVFERYHRDLKYWGVEKPFLEKFPELAQDISLCLSDADPLYPVFHELGVIGDVHEDNSNADGASSDGFTELAMAELFDNYPQVA